MNYKKVLIQLSLLSFFFVLAYFISIAGKKKDYISLTGFAQGTTYRITYESKNNENLQAEVDSLLAEFDRSLSIFQPNSIISRFNRNEPGTIADPWFTAVFSKSFEVYHQTNGAFDITVGPIVNALGFGSGDTLDIDSTLIDSLKSYVGMSKVGLVNGKLIKSNDNIILDVNAIAQGYSVDLVAGLLEEKDIKNYLVEIGGEVRTKGRNQKKRIWHIGIDKPEEGNMVSGANLQAIISLQDRALATSGNYRKFYVKNGIKYVHTIDPKTGYPVVSNLLSATVVAPDCITADAYATAMMVLGVDKSLALLKQHEELDAVLIYTDEQGKFRVYISPALEKFVE